MEFRLREAAMLLVNTKGKTIHDALVLARADDALRQEYFVTPTALAAGAEAARAVQQQAASPQASSPGGDQFWDRMHRTITEVGLHYMPHPNVVVKADYRDFESDGEANNQDELQLGIGYNF